MYIIGGNAPKRFKDFAYGDRLLIEPIYPITVGGSVYVLTVAEIGVLGAKTYGAGSISATYDQNTWKFIANHTNKYFPGSLMTTEGSAGVYPATSQPTKCITFPEIISGGYGISAVWNTRETPISFDGLAKATIKLGDVFDPLEHLDKFTFPTGTTPVEVEVIYNGVPRDAENKATTVGTGYTVVYNISFNDKSIGEYRLVVTVLEYGPVGQIRFIAFHFLDTLKENSKWRTGDLQTRLKNTLSIQEPTDDDAVEVWTFTPDDIQAVKNWVKETQSEGREAQNAQFHSKFGYCQTKN